jgi:hypothetical protein
MSKTLHLDQKKSYLTRMEYGAKAWERSADDHTAKKPIFTLMHGLAIF